MTIDEFYSSFDDICFRGGLWFRRNCKATNMADLWDEFMSVPGGENHLDWLLARPEYRHKIKEISIRWIMENEQDSIFFSEARKWVLENGDKMILRNIIEQYGNPWRMSWEI